MKKLIIYILMLCTIPTFAQTVEIEKLTYNLDPSTKTAEVVANNQPKQPNIVIPSFVVSGEETYSVTSIGGGAFRDFTSIQSVELPNTITSIQANAFRGCSNLVIIVNSNTLSSIGANAFNGCNKLQIIELPKTVTSIGASAFEKCFSLTSIDISNVSSISAGTFSECSLLNDVKISNSLTSIEKSAFHGCSALSRIIIPATVSFIDENAFHACNNLKIIYNYALTPQVINNTAFDDITYLTCLLYVPQGSLDAYKEDSVWKNFFRINETSNSIDTTKLFYYHDNDGYEINKHAVELSLPEPDKREGYQFLKWVVLQGDLDEGIHVQAQYVGEGTDKNLFYLDKDGEELHSHYVTLSLPEPEEIPGYTFQKWVVVGGDLDDGIHVQAQYIDNGGMSDVQTLEVSEQTGVRKTIRNGQVFILKGNKVFDISGRKVK